MFVHLIIFLMICIMFVNVRDQQSFEILTSGVMP
jgi:hypothetical protein